MPTTRRDLLKLGMLAGAGFAAGGLARATPLHTPVPPAARPLDILILGGTGFIGPSQVQYALARGHRLTLFNRGKRPQEWPAQVEELTGDRDTGELSALKGRSWDVVIDNPTSVPHWVRDVGAVLAGNTRHYIFVSTISVYADPSRPDLAETAPLAQYRGPDAMAETMASLRANMELYGPLKAASEAEAEKQFPGITTIVRPGLIVGPGDPTDRFTYWPVRLARGGKVLAPGDGADPAQFIDARDLAEWMVRLAEQRAFGIYNATGPAYPLDTAAMLHGIRATQSNGAELVWVPAPFLRGQQVAPWGDMPVWMPRDGEMGGLLDVSIARALDEGLTFRPLATTAADTLAWYRAQPAERQAQLRSGISAEREAAVLAAWEASGKRLDG